ncbi:MAG: hypothetical protein JNN10_04575 [Sphingopyxis sp.]|uniref:hypothetical protein n=1 Tax=Sphingopyxis sp. TaxID=1908224 RepID=UPI001A3E9E59|nr:hypothetical protein [Sphingopyxis sp.]MBL9065550.1 hypothetical protein [Sphingopyxis sp.]
MALSLLAAGCSAPEDEQPPTAAVTPDVPTHQATGRNVAGAELAIAIGPACKKVTRSEYKGEASGQSFYAAQCTSGEYLVSIKQNGSTSILDCGFAANMGTPCWQPW